MPLVAGNRFLFSTAVVLTELVKLAICLSASLFDISRTLPPSMPATSLFSSLYTAVFAGDSWRLAIPAVLFTVQNFLQYVAISNLDAATFQVTFQLKILATALFSVAILGRRISPRAWSSLLLLTAGVAIVQWPSKHVNLLLARPGLFHFPRSIPTTEDPATVAAGRLLKRSATYEGIEEDFLLQNPYMNSSIGVAAAIIACFSSGLAGVYFEKILKSSPMSLWVRNVQLSFYSLFPALFVGVFMLDGEKVANHGFFAGYNWVVWMLIIFQAMGGILVAIVLNSTDAIAKNFATSMSIIVSLVASMWFFGFKLTPSVSRTLTPISY
jgi:drug/metabolite transporter (DMT)-like permease